MTYSTIRAAMGAVLILFSALMAAPAGAQATAPAAAVAAAPSGFRIGFADPDRVLREAEPAKNAQAKLEAEFMTRQKAITALGDALKAASDQFERESPSLSEAQRAQRQRQLVEQDRDFQRRRTQFQEDLTSRKTEELQRLSDRVNRIVRQVAEAEHYDAIVQEAIYINPKHDITDRVIKALNAAGS